MINTKTEEKFVTRRHLYMKFVPATWDWLLIGSIVYAITLYLLRDYLHSTLAVVGVALFAPIAITYSVPITLGIILNIRLMFMEPNVRKELKEYLSGKKEW